MSNSSTHAHHWMEIKWLKNQLKTSQNRSDAFSAVGPFAGSNLVRWMAQTQPKLLSSVENVLDCSINLQDGFGPSNCALKWATTIGYDKDEPQLSDHMLNSLATVRSCTVHESGETIPMDYALILWTGQSVVHRVAIRLDFGPIWSWFWVQFRLEFESSFGIHFKSDLLYFFSFNLQIRFFSLTIIFLAKDKWKYQFLKN